MKELGFITPEGQKALQTAERLFNQHLKKEDYELYGKLFKHVKSDEKIIQKFKEYRDQIKKVSIEAEQYFKKYKEGGDGINFARDTGHLFSIIQTRISKEENSIFNVWLDNIS